MSREFTLIGKTLKHTMSPPIHKRLFELSGKEGFYGVTEIPEGELKDRMSSLNRLSGYNVTIPYKVEIIPFLDCLDSSAELYSSVNCVKNENGVSKGFNTDCTGFLRAIEEGGASLSGRVLLLGCGGAGRTFAMETALHGGELTIAVRSGSEHKTEPVLKLIEKNAPNTKVTVTALDNIRGEFDLLINSTPVGMYPDCGGRPASEDVVSRCGQVFDAIYNPRETALIKSFKAQGKNAIGGMSMLVWQAAAAHEIWNGSVFNPNDIAALIKEMEEKMGG